MLYANFFLSEVLNQLYYKILLSSNALTDLEHLRPNTLQIHLNPNKSIVFKNNKINVPIPINPTPWNKN